jgi:hypothetical protein
MEELGTALARFEKSNPFKCILQTKTVINSESTINDAWSNQTSKYATVEVTNHADTTEAFHGALDKIKKCWTAFENRKRIK